MTTQIKIYEKYIDNLLNFLKFIIKIKQNSN